MGHGSSSPCLWPTSMRALVLCHLGRQHVRPPRAVRRRRVTGSPHNRGVSRRGEGLPGCGAILFVRAMVEHPAGYHPLLAQSSRRGWLLPSGKTGPSASGKAEVSGPHSLGPHARMPTLRLPCLHDRRKAGYRLGRAHPWPGGIRTRWTTNKVSWRYRILQFPLTHRAWSHCFSYP